MRLSLTLLFLYLGLLCFGQDSLVVDSPARMPSLTISDSLTKDSISSSGIGPEKKAKRKAKKAILSRARKPKNTVTTVSNTEESENEKRIDSWFSIAFVVWLMIMLFLLARIAIRLWRRKRENFEYEQDPVDGADEILLSRRDYYRNVYLKSEAWRRKRFVVLRRDNWCCVYCGAKATQVHHKRYAKNNIGSEPIEWLVSICKPCHDNIHGN